MAKKDAEITVGANADAVTRAAAVAKTAWRDASSAISQGFGEAARNVVLGLSDIALAQGKINFGAQHQQVVAFEGATARLSIAMGRDLETVRSSLEATGVAIGKRPGEVASWTQEVGKLTYNFEGASSAMRGVAELAASTGRSVEDYRSLAAVLMNVGVSGEHVGRVFGIMKAQADFTGMRGGVAALADQMAGLGETISHFAQSEGGLTRISALVANLSKNIGPQQASRVSQTLLGAIVADPMRARRMVGHDITNEWGQIEDPVSLLAEMQQKTIARFGNTATARRIAMQPQNLGPEAGAALFNVNWGQVKTAAGLAPSSMGQQSLQALMGTDAGKRMTADAVLAESSRHLMGSSTALGRAADALQRFAASSPVTSTLISSSITASLSGFMTQFGRTLSVMAPGGAIGGGGALAGAGRILGATTRLAGSIGAAGAITGIAAAGIGALESYGEGRIVEGYRDPAKDKQLSASVQQWRSTRDALHRLEGLTGEQRGTVINAAATMQHHGQQVTMQSMLTELRREGKSAADAEMMAAAFKKALESLQIHVVNETDNPLNAIKKMSNSPSAGSQRRG